MEELTEEEARAKLRLIEIEQEQLALAAPAPEPEVVVEEEVELAPAATPTASAMYPALGLATSVVEDSFGEDTLFGRTLDRARGATSDAFSTLAGDTYGLSGDPTERDDLNLPQRLIKAAGRDVIPGGAEIVGDVISTITPEPVKEGLTQAAQWAGENLGESGYAQGAKYGLENIGRSIDMGAEAIGPEHAATVNELVNIAAVTSPSGIKSLGGSLGNRMDNVLKKTLAKERRANTQLRMEPDNRRGEGKLTPGTGPLERTKYVPDPGRETRRIDKVNALEGYDPKASYVKNHEVVEAEVLRINKELDKALETQYPVRATKVKESVGAAVEEAGKSHHMVGDAAASAEKIFVEFDRILNTLTSEGGFITPKNLLRARRELDDYLRAGDPRVFDPKTISATKTATQHIRTAINDLVDKAAKDAGVSGKLEDMHDLLIAKEQFYTRSLPSYERPTNIGRAVQRVEHSTGMKAPTTPIAAIQLADIIPATATAAVLGENALRRGIQSNVNAAVNMGETAGIRSALINSRAAAEEEEYR